MVILLVFASQYTRRYHPVRAKTRILQRCNKARGNRGKTPRQLRRRPTAIVAKSHVNPLLFRQFDGKNRMLGIGGARDRASMCRHNLLGNSKAQARSTSIGRA